VGLALIAVATLSPAADPRHLSLATPIWCLICGEEGAADVVANLLLFLPFAIGLRLSGVSWRRTVVAAAAVSFTVELLQLTVIPGRDASLSDLLTNTTSGAIGAALTAYFPAMLAPTPRRARALLAGGAAVWLAALSLSAWLLAPGVPDGSMLSMRPHVPRAPDVFGGRVDRVELNGRAMPLYGSPPDSAGLRRRLERGTFAVDAGVLSGRPVPDRSWIYLLLVGTRSTLTLFQDGREAGLELPARGLRFRLRAVTFTLADGLPAMAGVPVRLRATGRGREFRLSSAYAGVQRSIEFGLSPATGWMLVAPFDPPAGWARWITGLCLVATLLPLGYWGRGSGRPVAALALLAAVLAAGLAGLPALGGFPPVHWSEWVAGGAGMAAGWAAGQFAAYLQRRCASPSDSDSSSS
jgi:hypothetical protein